MDDNTVLKTVKFLLEGEQISEVKKTAKLAYSVRNNLIDIVTDNLITELDFYKITSLLAPQSRSPLWEKYFILKNHCTKVAAQENRGDFIWNGVHYEFKASGYNQTNGVNIVQIRLWHDCDYVIQYISDSEIKTFVLSHDEMEAETELMRATSAHGTKKIQEENTYIERRMTVKLESPDWERWNNKYARKL